MIYLICLRACLTRKYSFKAVIEDRQCYVPDKKNANYIYLKIRKKKFKLEALERLYRSTGLIFLQWQKFLTIIIQSLHFSSLKKKGMEKTCEKRRKKW